MRLYEGDRADAHHQFLNGAGNSPKDRVALSIIELVRLIFRVCPAHHWRSLIDEI
jgi:hypothetical protein